jgi:transposase
MTRSRRKFTPEQKAAIVRKYLKDKVPVSDLADEFSIQPTQIHQWVAAALEQMDEAFEKKPKSLKSQQLSEAKVQQLQAQRIKKLEEKLTYKNEVIAELMEENVKAKKASGDL